jgi:CubicO group peptidase (beta-lactamase class C family)
VLFRSPLSIFGHAGFTGTWAWADPEENLIFIFLSNRTYPNDNVNILAKKGYRGKMMEAVYRGLK